MIIHISYTKPLKLFGLAVGAWTGRHYHRKVLGNSKPIQYKTDKRNATIHFRLKLIWFSAPPSKWSLVWLKDSVSGGIQYIGVKVFASLISNYFDFVK